MFPGISIIQISNIFTYSICFGGLDAIHIFRIFIFQCVFPNIMKFQNSTIFNLKKNKVMTTMLTLQYFFS